MLGAGFACSSEAPADGQAAAGNATPTGTVLGASVPGGVGGEPSGSTQPGGAGSSATGGATTLPVSGDDATPAGDTGAATTGQQQPSDDSGGQATVAGKDECAERPIPRAPMRRLTRFEFNNTVRDLLGVESRPADILPGEELGNGFSNDADQLGVSRILIDGYRGVAKQIADQVVADDAGAVELSGCDPLVTGETECMQQFVSDFGAKAFRRPLEAREQQTLEQVFTGGREIGGDFAAGVRAVVEAALQMPQFLYRPEFGVVAEGATELGRPTSIEMATRLSYLIWGSLPDAALMDAAANDTLKTREQISAQAARMIDDPKARDVISHFHTQWLGLGGLDTLQRSEEYYPTFSPGMGSLFREETTRFIDHVVWEGEGDLATLMSAPFTFVNQELAEFYGISGVVGDEFQRVELDPNQRAGIITQASVMSMTTPGSRTNPIVRAKWLLNKIVCIDVQDPPVGLMVEEPEVVPGLTTRERFSAHREDPSCRGCHQLLDPVGFAFENYDGVGAWRDMDNDLPIDASGELPASDAAGPFDGPIELISRLAASQDAKDCYVGSWLAYGYGLSESDAEACARQELEQAFAVAGGDVRELLLALTQTDSFLYRPLPTQATIGQ